MAGGAEVHTSEWQLVEVVNDFQAFPNQKDERRNNLILVHKVPEEKFLDLEEGDIQEIFNCYAAELTEEDLEQPTVLSKPEDEDSEAV